MHDGVRNSLEVYLQRLHAPGSAAYLEALPALGRPLLSELLPRLLLIEADEPVAAAVVRGVRRAGWSVLHVATAAAALQMKAEFAPHVVLMALDLPDMDGEALVACLAQQEDCGIIALSGRGEAGSRGALAGGAHDYLTKPMVMREVMERVEAVQHRLAAVMTPVRTCAA